MIKIFNKKEESQIDSIKNKVNQLINADSNGFVIFDIDGVFVQYTLEDEGLMLFFPNNFGKKITIKLGNLLKEYDFKTVEKEIEFESLDKLEFVYENEKGGGISIYAQCGKNLDFIALLTDKIFREVFRFVDNYKIKTELVLSR